MYIFITGNDFLCKGDNFPIYLGGICIGRDTGSMTFGRQTFGQHGIKIDMPRNGPINMLTDSTDQTLSAKLCVGQNVSWPNGF
jgi:hypothetical protein